MACAESRSSGVGQAVKFINQLEQRIKTRFPEVAWCIIEPDNIS